MESHRKRYIMIMNKTSDNCFLVIKSRIKEIKEKEKYQSLDYEDINFLVQNREYLSKDSICNIYRQCDKRQKELLINSHFRILRDKKQIQPSMIQNILYKVKTVLLFCYTFTFFNLIVNLPFAFIMYAFCYEDWSIFCTIYYSFFASLLLLFFISFFFKNKIFFGLSVMGKLRLDKKR